MSSPVDRARSSAVHRGPGAIAVAIGVMNLSTYGFTIVAARQLGPTSYGAFASLMATLLVISVLALSLQATAARRISAEPDDVAQIETSILRVTYRASLVLGVVLLALTPLVNELLRLESLATAAMVAFAAVPLTVMGGQAGVLQGERRWWPLATMYVASGVPRLVIGTALVLGHPNETAAMLGVTLGAFPAVGLGWWALHGHRDGGVRTTKHEPRRLLGETVQNAQALLAFLALSNVDILVARNVLPEHSAGLYAAGLILTKAVLFLPQFVVVVAFPSMATTDQRRRALTRSLVLVAVLGAGATVGAFAFKALALVFVGGDDYREVASTLWLFAILGTTLAMLQLVIYAVLARQGRRSVYLVWAAFVCVGLMGPFVHTLEALVTLVVTIDGTLCAVLLAATFHRYRRDESAVD